MLIWRMHEFLLGHVSRQPAVVMDSYKIDYCIRGFHAYNTVWTPVIGEELICRQEPSNVMDPYAVSVIKDSIVVGHLPRRQHVRFSSIWAEE